MGNEINELNGVGFADIAKVNGVAPADITHVNGMDLVQSVAEAAVTAYTEITAASATSTGASMTYDEDNDFVYVQYPRNGGGGAAIVGSFNSTPSSL